MSPPPLQQERRDSIAAFLDNRASLHWFWYIADQQLRAIYPEPVPGVELIEEFMRDACMLFVVLPPSGYPLETQSRLEAIMGSYAAHQCAAATRRLLVAIEAPVPTAASPSLDPTDYAGYAKRLREVYAKLKPHQARRVSWLIREPETKACLASGCTEEEMRDLCSEMRNLLGFAEGKLFEHAKVPGYVEQGGTPSQVWRPEAVIDPSRPESAWASSYDRMTNDQARDMWRKRFPFALDEESVHPDGFNQCIEWQATVVKELLAAVQQELPDYASLTGFETYPAQRAAAQLVKGSDVLVTTLNPSLGSVAPVCSMEDLGVLLRYRRQIFCERTVLRFHSQCTELETLLLSQACSPQSLQVVGAWDKRRLGYVHALPLSQPGLDVLMQGEVQRHDLLLGHSKYLAKPGEAAGVYWANYLNLAEKKPVVNLTAMRLLSIASSKFASEYLDLEGPGVMIGGGGNIAHNGPAVMVRLGFKRKPIQTSTKFKRFFTKDLSDQRLKDLGEFRDDARTA